jgi:hypothetical protein
MLLEDVAHGLVGHIVAEIRQSTLDAVVSPRGILMGEAEDQIDDLLLHGCPPSRSSFRNPLPRMTANVIMGPDMAGHDVRRPISNVSPRDMGSRNQRL